MIISTPRDVEGVHAHLGNEHAAHVSQWQKKDFESLGDHFFIPNISSIIVYIGKDTNMVKVDNVRSALFDRVKADVPAITDRCVEA
jgi:hypothetical protein